MSGVVPRLGNKAAWSAGEISAGVAIMMTVGELLMVLLSNGLYWAGSTGTQAGRNDPIVFGIVSGGREEPQCDAHCLPRAPPN